MNERAIAEAVVACYERWRRADDAESAGALGVRGEGARRLYVAVCDLWLLVTSERR